MEISAVGNKLRDKMAQGEEERAARRERKHRRCSSYVDADRTWGGTCEGFSGARIMPQGL